MVDQKRTQGGGHEADGKTHDHDEARFGVFDFAKEAASFPVVLPGNFGGFYLRVV
jgi:hypothetical protein